MALHRGDDRIGETLLRVFLVISGNGVVRANDDDRVGQIGDRPQWFGATIGDDDRAVRHVPNSVPHTVRGQVALGGPQERDPPVYDPVDSPLALLPRGKGYPCQRPGLVLQESGQLAVAQVESDAVPIRRPATMYIRFEYRNRSRKSALDSR